MVFLGFLSGDGFYASELGQEKEKENGDVQDHKGEGEEEGWQSVVQGSC